MKDMSKIEAMLLDADAPYFQPFFYNNALALRCALGVGRGEEYMKNARERAGRIASLLFPDGPDAAVFNHPLYDLTDSGPAMEREFAESPGEAESISAGYLRQVIWQTRFLLTMQLKYRHRAVRGVRAGEDGERRVRMLCYADGTPIDAAALIGEELKDRYHCDLGLVSFENECVLCVYDDRGCDIVFADARKFIELYPLLEPYFLEYDRPLMEERLRSVEASLGL